MPPLPAPLGAALAATGFLAAWFDWRYRRLPNWLTLSAFLLGLGLQVRLAGLNGLWQGLAGAGLALLIHVPLYALRAVGGGDVKLMAAVGAIAGPPAWLVLFVLNALAGGAAALAMVVWTGRLPATLANIGVIFRELAALRPPHRAKPDLDVYSGAGLRLPRGVVMGVSIAMYLVALTLGG